MRFREGKRVLILLTTLSVAILLAFTAGCGKKEQKPVKDESKIDELRETINAETGQYFEVFLESNPSTGYTWQTVQPPDENVIKLVSTRFMAPAGEAKMGAPGHEVLQFVGTGAGSTMVVLEYSRPWQKNKLPAKRYTLTANITQADNEVASSVSVEAGHEFDLALNAEPGAGYSWTLAKRPDESILKFVKTEVIPSQAPGAPAVEVWKFLGVIAGNTSFVLEYRGPGGTSEPVKTHRVKVTVTPAPSKPKSPKN